MRIRLAAAPGLALALLAITNTVAHTQVLTEQRPDVATPTPKGPGLGRFGVAGTVSSLGIGVDFGVPVMKHANLRVAFHGFGLSHDFDDEGLTVAAKLKMRSFVTQLDWYPFNGGFHVSPGLMLYNGIQIDAKMSAPVNHTFLRGNETLVSNASNPLRGDATIKFKTIAPTIALGWGNLIPRTTARRWSIPFEFGLAYTRSPTGTMSISGTACRPNGTNCRDLAVDPGLQGDVAKQESDMNHDLTPFKIFPILSVVFSYRF
jgi:hypothetical protein